MQDERKEALRDSSIMELREVNRMMYLRPDNGSLIDKRTHKEYNFSNLSYKPGATMQAQIQSGADAIWGPSSYLKLKVKLSGAEGNTFSLKSGSLATNMIESVRLTHRSGEIIEFIDKFNLLSAAHQVWGFDIADNSKLESMLNAGSATDGTTKTWTVPAAGSVSATLIVPMSLLCGCFNNAEQYIPPNFLAGAKLELKIASLPVIFSNALAGGVDMEVEPAVVLDSSKVYDSVAAQLLDQQADVARAGLQFTYSTWFNNSSNSAGGQINVDVQQSASITQKVLAFVRKRADVDAPAGKDVFATLPGLANYQWRLGSTYYPQARVQLDAGQGEAYQQTLIAWDSSPNQYRGHKSDGNCGVPLRFFEAAANNIVVPHYATTLEKSGVGLTLTGEPTNNSRSLNFSGTVAGVPDAGGYDVQIYLQYTRICNIMGENLVVDR